MKIIYATDIHEKSSHLHSLLKVAADRGADCIIIGGDIVPKKIFYESYGKGLDSVLLAQKKYLEEEFAGALKAFRDEHPGVSIFLDMSNDDFMANRHVLEAHAGVLFRLLHMRRHSLADGVDIIGYMCVPPTPFGMKDWEKPDTADFPHTSPDIRIDGIRSEGERIVSCYLDLYSDDTIEKDMEALSMLVERPFVFVSHTPPYQTPLDMLYGSRAHVGSRAVRQFIEKWAEDGRLIVSLHGHIHESPAVSGMVSVSIGNALCVNPGQDAGFRYFEFSINNGRVKPC